MDDLKYRFMLNFAGLSADWQQPILFQEMDDEMWRNLLELLKPAQPPGVSLR